LGLEELRDDRKGEPGLQWGVLISTVRTLRGWGQEELARRAGVNTSTVSRQERGTAQAREAVRKKILNALGLQEIEERVRFELGGIRAMMLAPSREVVRPGIEEAAAETRQFITDALERWFRDNDDGGQEEGPRVVLPEGEGQDPEQI
jgi:transcriptional regulator with XRE-family HTH domain